MKKFTRVICLLAVLVMLFSTVACKKVEESEPSSSSASSSSESISASSRPETPMELNYLTGLNTVSQRGAGKRPVAIMISNIGEALPQLGIGSADILFEIPVEGGITRCMGVFGDMCNIPTICSIRSCRYYFPIFAVGFDAVYVHWGQEQNYAVSTLSRLGVERIAAGGSMDYVFSRNEDRLEQGYAIEHTGQIDGSLIPEACNKLGFDTNMDESITEPFFKFNDPAAPADLGDEKCEEFTIYYSNSYYGTFTYNADDCLYYKQHSGDVQIDGLTGDQIAFTNVLILETDIGVLDWSSGIRSVDWRGGTGYAISNGTLAEITWSKAGEREPIVILDADGNEQAINAGKTYIGVCQYGTVDFGD